MNQPLQTQPDSAMTPLSGLVALVADAILLFSLLRAGIDPATVSLASWVVATAAAAALLAFGHKTRRQMSWFATTAVLVFFLRGAVLAGMLRLDAPIVTTAAVTALGSVLLLHWLSAAVPGHPGSMAARRPALHDPVLALLIYALLLRLFYLGLTELIHEEAYYWNYSRHLALSYLDHPPMVAWLIRGFTGLFGNTLVGVRAGAFIAWLVGAGFLYALTRRRYDRSTAQAALLLFAALPVYFLFGLLMSPDMPLTACWAAALYFYYRALVDEIPSAWLGAGVALGLGLLSKYTIVLLGFAVFVFMLTDRRARKWFARPQPWLTAGIALLLFTPVIAWNYQNDWASFVFQGPRRAGGQLQFDLPELLGTSALLITPVGLAAVAVAMFSGSVLSNKGSDGEGSRTDRGYRLLMISTLVPFAVFLAFSLFRNTKLNWTGPLWVGSLPFMAWMMTRGWPRDASRWQAWLSPIVWRRTLLVVLLFLGFVLHFLVLGFPGLRYPENRMGLPARGWPELAQQVEAIVEKVERDYGAHPLVVGLKRDRLSSWLAYYRSRAMASRNGENTGAAAWDTAGPNLFGQPDAHMYELWFPSLELYGDRPLVLIGDTPAELDVDAPGRHPGPVGQLKTGESGQVFWRIYYRVLGPVQPSLRNPEN